MSSAVGACLKKQNTIKHHGTEEYHASHLLIRLSDIPQENRPTGTSVLQLAVTDRDASHNGPPFTFAIVDGNEGDAFRINQQGALVAVGVLNRKSKEHYLLQAQVSHSGEVKPQLRGCIDLTVKPQQPNLFVFPLLPLCTFSLSCLIYLLLLLVRLRVYVF